VKTPGSIVLNAKLLGEMIRQLDGDEVSLEVTEVEGAQEATISDNRTVYRLLGQAGAEFPEIPEVEEDGEMALPQGTLKSMIKETIFCLIQDESRPVYTGIQFRVEDDILTLVSADGYRLALRCEAIENAKLIDGEFIVPGLALAEIERMLEESDEPMTLFSGDKHVTFKIANKTLITRKLHGDFLDHSKAIPTIYDHKIVVDRRLFLAAVERVSTLIREGLKSPVRCQFDGDTLSLLVETPIGSAKDYLSLEEGDGGGLKIGFNHRFLIEALRNIQEDKVVIEMKNSSSAWVLRPPAGEAFAYLILPIRLGS